MILSILEEEEIVTKLTVIAVGETPERAINYLHEKKQINTNLYTLKGKKNFLSSYLQPSDDYLELLRAGDSRSNQNISDGLKNISSPVVIVVDQRTDNLKVAQHICSKLREQRETLITVTLNSSITNPSNDLLVDISNVTELTDAWLELDVDTDKSEENNFNKLSSLIELIFYNYQEDDIGCIDYADVLTILASNNKLNNCKAPSINHSYYLSSDGSPIYKVINYAISTLQDKPAKNSNVLAQVILNTERRDYGELEAALQAIREHYTGQCYIAPIHDPNMNNADIHATVFITNTEISKGGEQEIPHFLRK